MASETPAGGLSAYIAVTIAYWTFMLTDGALRMLLLLHFHSLDFSPIQLAYLFMMYEFTGLVTNLSAGWLGARFGLVRTLYAGLALQVFALLALTQLNTGWTVVASLVFVMTLQGISGVAKDLAKTSSKSAVKLLAPDDSGELFKWTARLTGSKNAVKGIGFLTGAVLLAICGYSLSLFIMAGVLAVVLIAVAATMSDGLPGGDGKSRFKDVFSTVSNINRLSLARMFLIGSRDVWLVVGIPIYFYGVISDGTAAGERAACFQVGLFTALWIVGYGLVQSFAPDMLRARRLKDGAIVRLAERWALGLAFIPGVLTLAAVVAGKPADWLSISLVAGLLVFGVVFAINSALHSYLIMAFSTVSRVTMDVGFYYMANAAGRLVGTFLSGMSYQLGGLPLCLATATVMVTCSWLAARRIH